MPWLPGNLKTNISFGTEPDDLGLTQYNPKQTVKSVALEDVVFDHSIYIYIHLV